MADGRVTAPADSGGGAPVPVNHDTPDMTVLTGHVPSPDNAKLKRHRSPVSAPALKRMARYADIILAFLISYICLRLSGTTLMGATVGTALPFVLLPVIVAIGLDAAGAYHFAYARTALDHMLRAANGSGLALALLAGLVWLLIGNAGAAWPVIACLVTWIAIIAMHAHFMAIIKALTRSGRLSENVVIVGATANARRLIARNQETRELNIVGVFDDRLSRAPTELGGVPLLGRIDDLMEWQNLPDIDRIVVTVTSDARERVRGLIDRLRVLPQRVILLLDLEGFDPETESLAEIARSPAAYVSGTPRDSRRAVIKRMADFFFGAAMLIAFSPLLIITAIAIKLESPGPVFFRQRRHGFNNQIIRVWKFRSMRDDKAAAETMSAQTQKDDPRVTRVGKFIRKTSIDEMPQLFNVLKGEMSIVGPRPHALGMTAEATEVHAIVGDYAHRHRVKPGITGWAQINGSRGPVHTKHEVRERVRYDMEYVNRSSFWFDIYIMIMTAPCLLGDTKRDR